MREHSLSLKKAAVSLMLKLRGSNKYLKLLHNIIQKKEQAFKHFDPNFCAENNALFNISN